jgi:putative ABC transport system permease protein
VETLRNIFRHKLRTSLTIFGIAIGIFALTVMGAMAEKMNLMVAGGIRFYTGQITITGKGSFGPGTDLLPSSLLKKIEKIKGVESVQPEVSFLLAEDQGMISFGMPDVVVGSNPGLKNKNRNWRNLELDSGRTLKKGDKLKCVVGADIATSKKLKVGDYLPIRKEKFKVVGIMKKVLTGPDKMVLIPISDARRLYVKSSPYLRALKKQAEQSRSLSEEELKSLPPEIQERVKKSASFKESGIITGASVYWKDGVSPSKLANKIVKKVKDIQALSPAEMKKQFQQASVIFNLIILGSALIALIVGGLSVINTMIMSVSERTREIGIKKAVGAKTRHILWEYLLEAGLIGLIGGLIGLSFGSLLASGINSSTASKGVEIFLVSQRLVISALAFAIILGAVAGIYPAVHAARLDPVKALRTE